MTRMNEVATRADWFYAGLALGLAAGVIVGMLILSTWLVQ